MKNVLPSKRIWNVPSAALNFLREELNPENIEIIRRKWSTRRQAIPQVWSNLFLLKPPASTGPLFTRQEARNCLLYRVACYTLQVINIITTGGADAAVRPRVVGGESTAAEIETPRTWGATVKYSRIILGLGVAGIYLSSEKLRLR